MRRCFDLAKLGRGSVSPNPIVGAVLVHNDRVIGEGYHQHYGGPHAEVNAVNSVSEPDRHLIPKSTLYVSLEPCCFHGKTPACTDLILKNNIKKVVIGCLDPNPKVNGLGAKKLTEAGIEVISAVLENEASQLIAEFRVNSIQKKPYVILKYAVTKDGYLSALGKQFWITNAFTKRLVHKWRSEVDGILIGRQTAMIDDPRLTNRLYYGESPRRIILSNKLEEMDRLQLFLDGRPTIVAGAIPIEANVANNVEVLQINTNNSIFPSALLSRLWEDHKIGILMIEGGAKTLQTFIDQGLWNEARVFTGDRYLGSPGLAAPRIPGMPQYTQYLGSDRLDVFFHNC